MDIIGVGTIAMDILLQVDKLPKEDGFCVISHKEYLPGGSGTNVIVQAKRLGASCSYIAKLGDDSLGKDILMSLKNENIYTKDMVIKENGVSLHTQIVVDNSGKKFILLDMGDCFLTLPKEKVSTNAIKEAKVFYTDLLPKNAAMQALEVAKDNGLLTAFNMQVDLHSMNNFGISKKEILNSLQYVDFFAPCRDGLYQLCETENIDKCREYLLPYFNKTLLITLGEEGSVAYKRKEKIYQEPIKTNVIDTTGAGDSYMGAMLYFYLLKQHSLKEAMLLSSHCASITCSKFGARSSPSMDELKTKTNIPTGNHVR